MNKVLTREESRLIIAIHKYGSHRVSFREICEKGEVFLRTPLQDGPLMFQRLRQYELIEQVEPIFGVKNFMAATDYLLTLTRTGHQWINEYERSRVPS